MPNKQRYVPSAASAIRKAITAGIAAILFVCLLTGCGRNEKNVSEEREERPVITVGCDTYSPFSYVDVDGNMTGIDVELANEAFDRLGYRPVFTIINWENKKKLLEEGTIDCIWSSFTMDGRGDEYQWAGPYMRSHQVVAVNEDSALESLQDLKDKVIAVQSSTKPEDIIRSHDGTLPDLHRVISVQKRDLLFVLLSKGYVDAIAAHDTSVEQFMLESGLRFRILDEPLQTVGLGVAFRKSDTSGLNTKLTKVLDDMCEDGTTKQILSKYVAEPDRYLGGGK